MVVVVDVLRIGSTLGCGVHTLDHNCIGLQGLLVLVIIELLAEHRRSENPLKQAVKIGYENHCELAMHNGAYFRKEEHSLAHGPYGERNLACDTRLEILQNPLKAVIYAELVYNLRDIAQTCKMGLPKNCKLLELADAVVVNKVLQIGVVEVLILINHGALGS